MFLSIAPKEKPIKLVKKKQQHHHLGNSPNFIALSAEQFLSVMVKNFITNLSCLSYNSKVFQKYKKMLGPKQTIQKKSQIST